MMFYFTGSEGLSGDKSTRADVSSFPGNGLFSNRDHCEFRQARDETVKAKNFTIHWTVHLLVHCIRISSDKSE
jgi:hypothetical protein